MSAPETPFTDKNATERGLKIAQQKAPLFAAHIEAEKARMERIAQEVTAKGFPQTGKAMTKFAHDI